MKNTPIQKIRELISKNQFVVLLSKSLGHEQLKEQLKKSKLNCLLINLKNADTDDNALLGIAEEILAQTRYKVDMKEAITLYRRIFETSLNPENIRRNHVLCLFHQIFQILDDKNQECIVFYLYPIEKFINITTLINFFEQINDAALYSKLRFVLLSKPGLLDSANLRPFKFVSFDNLGTKAVYISYKWNDVSNNIVYNQLIPSLDMHEIPYVVDTKDCSFMKDIVDFEQKFQSAEKVIIVLCRDYMFSLECMYEMACVCENVDKVELSKKMSLINVGDFEQTDTQFEKVKKYWEDKSTPLYAEIEKNPAPANEIYKKKLERIDKICANLSNFWQFVNKKNSLFLRDVLANSCEILINHLGCNSNTIVLEYDEYLDIEGS